MTYKEYKQKVFENLVSRIGEGNAIKAMNEYNDDLPELYKKDLSVVATVTAIIMGY